LRMATVIHNAPEYPVVDPEPTFGKVFRAMRQSEFMMWGVHTVAGAPMGWIAGSPGLKRHTMWVGVSVFSLGGLMLGLQDSFYRLMGFKENSLEVEKYGVYDFDKED